jgi:hypothetical protein
MKPYLLGDRHGGSSSSASSSSSSSGASAGGLMQPVTDLLVDSHCKNGREKLSLRDIADLFAR